MIQTCYVIAKCNSNTLYIAPTHRCLHGCNVNSINLTVFHNGFQCFNMVRIKAISLL